MVNTPTFTLEETQAIVDEAHRKGLKVACHAYGGEGLHNCITAGVDVPTHGVDLDDESLKLLVQKKLPLTVTMFDLSMEDAQEVQALGQQPLADDGEELEEGASRPASRCRSAAARDRFRTARRSTSSPIS